MLVIELSASIIASLLFLCLGIVLGYLIGGGSSGQVEGKYRTMVNVKAAADELITVSATVVDKENNPVDTGDNALMLKIENPEGDFGGLVLEAGQEADEDGFFVANQINPGTISGGPASAVVSVKFQGLDIPADTFKVELEAGAPAAIDATMSQDGQALEETQVEEPTPEE